MSISLRVLLLTCLLSSLATEQIRLGEFGFTMTGKAGSAGGGCWGASCTPTTMDIIRGETVLLHIGAPFGAPYLIGLSLGPSQCTRFPGLQNELLLDPASMVVLAGGAVSQRSSMRFCYSGFENQNLFVPMTAPIGMQLVFQTISVVANNKGVMVPTGSPSVLATIK